MDSDKGYEMEGKINTPLNRLESALEENNKKRLFPCIEDILVNGISPKRFSKEERVPSRQDVTQFIAAWFKHIRVSADECREWMIEYCVNILSSISDSSKSKIRHSTKSNIKYIYGSDAVFDCNCENNILKAYCSKSCPVYGKMRDKREKREEEEAETRRELEAAEQIEYEEEEAPKVPTIKEKYIGQFEEAVKFAHDNLVKGVHKRRIVMLLNDNGFKSRSGKKWTLSLLGNELRTYIKEEVEKEKNGCEGNP